jgi:acyl-CoA dehydrogenase
VTIVRDVPVFGRHDQHGHCEVVYDDVRVPVTNILGEEGAGFTLVQAAWGRDGSTTACAPWAPPSEHRP